MLTICKGSYGTYKRNELKKVAVPSAEEFGGRTDRWRGIQHKELVDGLIDAVDKELGLKPLNEQYAVSPNGAGLIGGFELGRERVKGRGKNKKTVVEPVGFANLPQETAQSLGFIHSNDSRRALTLSLGGRVFLCENGMVIGSVTFNRKHTNQLNLGDWLREGVGKIANSMEAVDEASGILNEYEMDPDNHSHGLIEAARQDIIPWHILGDFDRAWTKANDEGDLVWLNPENGNNEDWDFQGTLWDWYQAMTHVAKKVPPARQFNSLRRGFDLTAEFLPKTERNHLLNLSLDN